MRKVIRIVHDMKMARKGGFAMIRWTLKASI